MDNPSLIISKFKTSEGRQTQVGRQDILEEGIWNVYKKGIVFRINEEYLQINKEMMIMQQENRQNDRNRDFTELPTSQQIYKMGK